MINFRLLDKQTQNVLATIYGGKVEITEHGKAEMLQLKPCPKYGGSDLIRSDDPEYANAFYLFIINSILPSHPDWEWQQERQKAQKKS
jgi:hypothetical protein